MPVSSGNDAQMDVTMEKQCKSLPVKMDVPMFKAHREIKNELLGGSHFF